MGIKYHLAPDIQGQLRHIVDTLSLEHVDDRVICVRSYGSKSARTLARIHPLVRIMQVALGMGPRYAIEVLAENFDCLAPEQKTRVLIHELLHIPKAFGGGLKGHGFVNRRRVERLYERYSELRNAG